MERLMLGSTDPAMRYERTYCFGLDVGQAHDPSTICGVVRHTGQRLHVNGEVAEYFRPFYKVFYLKRLPLEMSYPQQIIYVASRLRRPPVAEAEPDVFIDYTGVGRPVFDMFKQAGVPHLKGVNITSGLNAEQTPVGWSVPKTVLVSTVQAKLHSGDLEIPMRKSPEAAVLMRELHDFRVNVTDAGNAQFGARSGAHDDLVLALALAIFGVDHQRRVRVMPLMG